MALRSQTTPAFEPMDAESALTVETSNANTAVAVRSAPTAVTTPTTQMPKLRLALAELNNVLDTNTVESLSLGSPRIKAEQGAAYQGDTSLGSKFRLAPVSYNLRWAIGTGTDDAEAKGHFRVSYDKQMTTEGESVTDYIAALKAQGYNKAGMTTYLDLWGFVTWAEKGGEVPGDQRTLVLVQCSPTSTGNFTSFTTSHGILESRGLTGPVSELVITAEARIKGTNKYTNFSFSNYKG